MAVAEERQCSCNVDRSPKYDTLAEFDITRIKDDGCAVRIGPGTYKIRRCRRCGGYRNYVSDPDPDRSVTVWPEDDPDVLLKDSFHQTVMDTERGS